MNSASQQRVTSKTLNGGQYEIAQGSALICVDRECLNATVPQ